MNNTFEDVNIKDRWRNILNRTLSDIRRKNKLLPPEWQNYSDNEVNFLLRIQDVNESYESIKSTVDILSLYQNGTIDYLEQSIYACLDRNSSSNLEEKFIPLFTSIVRWIHEEDLAIPGISCGCFHQAMFLHIAEIEDVEALSTATSIIYDECNRPGKFINNVEAASDEERENNLCLPKYNNVGLMRACLKNNYKLVQTFVSSGYR